jgi:hypothetical protein
VVGGILVIGTIFVSGYFFSPARASTVTFYPNSCLGGWTNSQFAEGAPDVVDGANLSFFSVDNSAVLNNSNSQLFCGGFKGDVPDGTKPTSIVVSFSWDVDDGSLNHMVAPTVIPDVIQNSDTSTPAAVIAPDVTPTPTPPTPSPSDTSNDLETVSTRPPSWLLPTAFADDISNNGDSSATTPLNDPMVDVAYTIDGATWQDLGMVDRNHWQDKSFTIPVLGWTDLLHLQISITPIATTDQKTVIYLDAMRLTVDYVASATQSTQYTSDVKKFLFTNVTTDSAITDATVSHDDNQGDTLSITASTPGMIHIFKTGDPTFGIETAIGTDVLHLPAFNFSVGHYIGILINNNDGCGYLDYDACSTNNAVIGKIQFDIMPSLDSPPDQSSSTAPPVLPSPLP